MNNSDIAAALEQIADLLEFQAANPFRVRAYRNGARVVRDLPEPATSIVARGAEALTEYEGIGDDLAEKISTLATTGSLPLWEELLSQVPSSVLALLRIPGVGPKKAATLHKKLRIKTLEELRSACESHRVQELEGFGEKTEKSILAGISQAAESEQRMYWAHADEHVHEIMAHLADSPGVEKLAPAGSYRRGRETVGDLDFVAVAKDPEKLMDSLAEYPSLAAVLSRGETKMSIRLQDGLQVDLRVVPPESFGAALQYFTGSKQHNVVLRGLAKERGLKINEYGVFRLRRGKEGETEKYIAGRTEEEVYAALKLPCFPPEMREARREFQWAEEGELPELIVEKNIRGDLHMHTDATDGTATLDEMIAAARRKGHEYVAITDHSKRVAMARGLDGRRLRKQWAEIDRRNSDLDDFHVLKGVEVDILEKGGLDLDDDVLAEADWVVASVHYGQNQSREQITERVLQALENRYVSAIGHPTGRLLNRRGAYEIDLDAVIKAARARHKFMELNANPARLDLDDVACAAAKAQGVKIVISSDAHSVEGLHVMRYGVIQARRGGLTKNDVLNARTWAQLKKLLAASRG